MELHQMKPATVVCRAYQKKWLNLDSEQILVRFLKTHINKLCYS
ncbi:hypothetical protein SAMN05660206_11558 [Sphingobacterium wenxiniae]|uniref:Uncharacterized protein n=1 Tax=Sphingobacterium wenxiniae TaxID=683125 RepID=A0A1I6VML3_9SPHI|nr:hypothetical protein SAMN05660206_11558 [Sphingobacterium wenxiniae]